MNISAYFTQTCILPRVRSSLADARCVFAGLFVCLFVIFVVRVVGCCLRVYCVNVLCRSIVHTFQCCGFSVLFACLSFNLSLDLLQNVLIRSCY